LLKLFQVLCESSRRLDSSGLVLSVGKLTADAMTDLPKNAVRKAPELCMTRTRLDDRKLLKPILVAAAIQRSGPPVIQLASVFFVR